MVFSLNSGPKDLKSGSDDRLLLFSFANHETKTSNPLYVLVVLNFSCETPRENVIVTILVAINSLEFVIDC